jgi:hypothetical protein
MSNEYEADMLKRINEDIEKAKELQRDAEFQERLVDVQPSPAPKPDDKVMIRAASIAVALAVPAPEYKQRAAALSASERADLASASSCQGGAWREPSPPSLYRLAC